MENIGNSDIRLRSTHYKGFLKPCKLYYIFWTTQLLEQTKDQQWQWHLVYDEEFERVACDVRVDYHVEEQSGGEQDLETQLVARLSISISADIKENSFKICSHNSAYISIEKKI